MASRRPRLWRPLCAVAGTTAVTAVAALLAVPDGPAPAGTPPPDFGNRRSAARTVPQEGPGPRDEAGGPQEGERDGPREGRKTAPGPRPTASGRDSAADPGAAPDGAVPPGGERSASPGPGSTPPSEDPVPDAPPVRVRIGRLGVDAEIRPVGVARDGTVAVPGDARAAGWYRDGAAPGATAGSALLIGHVDERSGRLGPLAALHSVRPGDRVTVHRDGGPPVHYAVAAREVVERGRLPGELFRRTGSPVLTMITCTLPYDRGDGGYRNNLVVTATRVSD
ncbi:class F sortase [Streptomyces zingiberis]|uniref:Sortase n=1 Tax=Streptomyces zingiberis TaxID=2053010 RepID=A0ABX1BNN4_9ACTN|nr:class F sortase [Streptomyces zingiberis]NJP99330.1 sortase [Streptomyces zingiberis]